MALLRFRRTRVRRAVAACVLCCMLLLQVAVAAYACPVQAPPSDPMPAMIGCEEMTVPDPEAPGLCIAHCQDGQIATPDVNPPQVPPSALPPLHFALIEALLPPVRAQYYEDVPVCRSDPPPAQRFCSLQI
ncbi:MAG: hypothetical protein ACOY82_02450 [Pseudomonadota bacterium]